MGMGTGWAQHKAGGIQHGSGGVQVRRQLESKASQPSLGSVLGFALNLS